MSDYIEREAVLQTIESCVGWSRPLEAAYEEIQAIPAADVAPELHAHWVHYLPALGAGDVQSRCSNCGRTADVETPYCAWCGAKMDKEDT